MTLGELVKHYRTALGMTQEELATKMGYSHKSAINKIEMGKNDLSQSKLMKMAECLHVSPADLISNSDVVFPESKKDNDLKIALFGKDIEVTDEMWNELLNYVEFLKVKYSTGFSFDVVIDHTKKKGSRRYVNQLKGTVGIEVNGEEHILIGKKGEGDGQG